jgi:hypothetical protein
MNISIQLCLGKLELGLAIKRWRPRYRWFRLQRWSYWANAEEGRWWERYKVLQVNALWLVAGVEWGYNDLID